MAFILRTLGFTLALVAGRAALSVALDQRLQASLTSAETVPVMPRPTLGVDVDPSRGALVHAPRSGAHMNQ